MYLDKFVYKKTNKNFSSLKQEIKDLKQKINDCHKTINDNHKTINDCHKTINDSNKTINDQKKEICIQKKEIPTQNVKISLLSEIHNSSEKNSKAVNAYVMNLGTQFFTLFNSCKVLFVRKIFDFLLEGLIDKHKNSFQK